MYHVAELVTEKVDFKKNVKKSAKKCKSVTKNAVEQSKSVLLSTLVGISEARLQPTPTPHLLLSNDAPTEHEITMIMDAVHRAEAEVETLTEQLARGVTWRELTLFKHEKATQFVSEHRAIISPIRRLPPEILQEIFLHAVDSGPNAITYYPWHNVANIPYGISQVSVLWRRTALNTPALWARIPTVPIERQFTTKPRYLAFLAEVLSRTRGAPLELSFYGPDRMASDGPHPAIEMLIAHSMSWKKVTIEVPSLELSMFDAIKGRLALLETLTIRGWYFISPNSDIPIDVFHDAPRLREVSLFHTNSKMITLPFSQLVHYHQEEVHVAQLNGLFISSWSSTLRSLSLRMYCENQVSIAGIPITLASLTVLKLRLHFSSTDYILLDQLFLPVLEELLVDSCVYTRRHPFRPIISLVTRAGQACPLRKLYIRSLSINQGELTTLLRQTPLITHLTMDIPLIDDFRNLFHDHNQILPCLQNCAFFTKEPLSEDHIDLCRMLADTRCERQQSEFGDRQVHSKVKHTRSHVLRALYIHYTTRDIAERQQKEFQQWVDTETSLRLSGMRASIIERFPELRSVWGPKNNARLRSQAPHILSSIRDIEVHDVNEIYVSQNLRTCFHLVSEHRCCHRRLGYTRPFTE